METAKQIINYTLYMIEKTRYTELRHRLKALMDVLDAQEYSWEYEKAIMAVCKIEEAETDAPDV